MPLPVLNHNHNHRLTVFPYNQNLIILILILFAIQIKTYPKIQMFRCVPSIELLYVHGDENKSCYFPVIIPFYAILFTNRSSFKQVTFKESAWNLLYAMAYSVILINWKVSFILYDYISDFINFFCTKCMRIDIYVATYVLVQQYGPLHWYGGATAHISHMN